jgi:O-antigen ligase
VRGSANLPFLLIGAIMAVVVIRWTMRHRAAALATVFIAVPLQVTVLAWLYSHGAPFAAVRAAGFFKEAVIAGLVLAVLQDESSRRASKGVADWAGMAFVALTTFYLALPAVVTGVLGGQPSDVRLSAWRINVIFVVLFLACRRLSWTRAEVRVLQSALLVSAAVLAAGAVWELLDEHGFNHFLSDVVQQPRFQVEVLNGKTAAVINVEALGSGTVTRIGSWVLNPLALGFCLVTPLAVGVHRLIAGRRIGLVALIALGTATAILSTRTRSAILAAVVALVVVFALSARGRQRRTLNVLLVTLLLAVCAAPFLPQTSVYHRFAGAVNGTEESAQSHEERTGSAWDLSLRSPLGLGLGANPGTGSLYGTDNYVTAENTYLQVALELGWLGAVLFIILTLALIRDCFVRARARPGGTAVAAAGAALGLALGGLFLHVWLDFQTSFLFWGFAGVASCRLLAAEPDEPALAEAAPALPAVSA